MSSLNVGEINQELGVGLSHGITHQEWKRERDKMQKQAEQVAQQAPDNSWYERGELPPVGCECEWVDESGVSGRPGVQYPAVGYSVSVCAHKQTPGGDVIAIFTWETGDGGLLIAASRMPSDFRPLLTERWKEVLAMASILIGCKKYSITQNVAIAAGGLLYDAGYRKPQGGDQ